MKRLVATIFLTMILVACAAPQHSVRESDQSEVDFFGQPKDLWRYSDDK